MPAKKTREFITADASLEQADRTSPALKELMHGQHSGAGHAEDELREEHYKGHHIAIKTTYEVKVDGKLFPASLGVSNAGNVQYHGIPNVGFASAMDLMRCIIDQFPEEFSKKAKTTPEAHHDHAGHDHGMPAAGAKKKKARSKTAGQ